MMNIHLDIRDKVYYSIEKHNRYLGEWICP